MKIEDYKNMSSGIFVNLESKALTDKISVRQTIAQMFGIMPNMVQVKVKRNKYADNGVSFSIRIGVTTAYDTLIDTLMQISNYYNQDCIAFIVKNRKLDICGLIGKNTKEYAPFSLRCFWI